VDYSYAVTTCKQGKDAARSFQILSCYLYFFSKNARDSNNQTIEKRLVPRRLTVSLSSKPLEAKDARVSDRSALGEGSLMCCNISERKSAIPPASIEWIEWTTSLRFANSMDYYQISEREISRGQNDVYTRTTPSLAAKATISAQETTPGHTFSISDLILSIISNPFKF